MPVLLPLALCNPRAPDQVRAGEGIRTIGPPRSRSWRRRSAASGGGGAAHIGVVYGWRRAQEASSRRGVDTRSIAAGRTQEDQLEPVALHQVQVKLRLLLKKEKTYFKQVDAFELMEESPFTQEHMG
ncbi:hypothetical protein ABZP36_001151 [Zizania latifolia]